jgi:hypothetical protein
MNSCILRMNHPAAICRVSKFKKHILFCHSCGGRNPENKELDSASSAE